jgi:hypothetical protein
VLARPCVGESPIGDWLSIVRAHQTAMPASFRRSLVSALSAASRSAGGHQRSTGGAQRLMQRRQGHRVKLDRIIGIIGAVVRRVLLRARGQAKLGDLRLGDGEALDRLDLDTELVRIAADAAL